MILYWMTLNRRFLQIGTVVLNDFILSGSQPTLSTNRYSSTQWLYTEWLNRRFLQIGTVVLNDFILSGSQPTLSTNRYSSTQWLYTEWLSTDAFYK